MNDRASQEALLTEGYRRCAQITWRYGNTFLGRRPATQAAA
jgi:hypothetical protein